MHFPDLIRDLAVILGVAAVVTFIFRRIKQPVVLGYIVAGIIVGPYTPAVFSVQETESIKIWAELGVIFLMFNLGLEFSFRRLARVGMSAGVTAILQIIAMLFWGIIVARTLGWGRMDAIFLGCMISISSTTIIIKALEELGLKSKKFAELVFGILIVEDLAAILMLVALTNIITNSQVGGLELLTAGGKLAIVVGAWFLVGMFVVPRFVKAVSKHGNDEMLTVVASALCLALVAVAAYFHYSLALGAFIMGSILAESSEAKRIEHLVNPLKDIFGAVFFVSVGMLLDPKTIIENLQAVLLISVVIIAGKLLSVTLGAFITGQTIRNAVQTGFSMAQIGEFSFIIASLGLAYGAISEKLYPIIVAASIITTFTTPYLVKLSAPAAGALERNIPSRMRTTMENYVAWVQRQNVRSSARQELFRNLTKWGLNAVVVITIYTIGSDKIVPMASTSIEEGFLTSGLVWLLASLLSAPSIWAMFSTFRIRRVMHEQTVPIPHGMSALFSSILTVGLVGALSIAYFPAFIILVVTISVCGLLFIVFKRHVEAYYHWMEVQFRSGFQADLSAHDSASPAFDRLAPWDAHLVEVKVPVRSYLVGRPLIDLKLREKYGLNVVVIMRDGENIVAPTPNESLYPGDRILCFATDSDIERFKNDLEIRQQTNPAIQDLEAYDISKMRVQKNAGILGVSIRQSGIREKYTCIVVGLERKGERLISPSSDTALEEGDILWVVGERGNLQRLGKAFV